MTEPDLGRLFFPGPQWGSRALTRVLKLPEWVEAGDLPFGAVPRERRASTTSKTDRVFWKTKAAAGLRVSPEDVAWSLEDLRGVQLYSVSTGGGWVELRLLWSGVPAWATLLVREPWDEALHERFKELGTALAKFLGVPLETYVGSDA